MTSQKKLMIVGGIAALAVAVQLSGYGIKGKASSTGAVPLSVELNTADGPTEKVGGPVDPLATPCASGVARVGGPVVPIWVWKWNGQMSLIGANCGPKTMAGSFMERSGVNVRLVNQDDVPTQKNAQVKFAQLLANGDPSPSGEDVAAFVVIMGDGSAQYMHDVNERTKKLGPDYQVEVVGNLGFSGNRTSGEDTCMGPAEWKDSPEKMKGSLITGYLRDGDWNICMDFINKQGIKNNPDEHYYDPEKVNWVAAEDYLKAAEQYITGYCEDRRVIHDGIVSSEPKVHTCVQGVATWTPGDVNIAKKKGGLVKLLSTKENYWQMGAVLIGNHKWNMSHRKQVTGILDATFLYAKQLKAYPEALTRASKASYAVYNDQTPAYWAKYYRGVTERDATGVPISLGGSRTADLADNLFFFGLLDGAGGVESSAFSASYVGFARVVQQQYGKVLPSFPAPSQAVNTTFLEDLAKKYGVTKPNEVETFEATSEITPENVTTKQNVNIQFETGKATFSPDATATLDRVFSQLANNNLQIQVDGHTDNTGMPVTNALLSQDRANAVKTYLKNRNPLMFPENRVITHGYGSDKPIKSNDTSEGRAANRRVTIILGEKGN